MVLIWQRLNFHTETLYRFLKTEQMWVTQTSSSQKERKAETDSGSERRRLTCERGRTWPAWPRLCWRCDRHKHRPRGWAAEAEDRKSSSSLWTLITISFFKLQHFNTLFVKSSTLCHSSHIFMISLFSSETLWKVGAQRLKDASKSERVPSDVSRRRAAGVLLCLTRQPFFTQHRRSS